jgi:hypothetical protein
MFKSTNIIDSFIFICYKIAAIYEVHFTPKCNTLVNGNLPPNDSFSFKNFSRGSVAKAFARRIIHNSNNIKNLFV